MKRIAVIAGGRPSYIKMAPIVRAIDDCPDLECVFVDPRQHYSANMRDIFFDEIGLRQPDKLLSIGQPGRTQAVQTAEAVVQMEDFLQEAELDAVLVHGDMNYALGCALAAVKLHILVIHNEAGLRSFDRRMPEEINRILMDHMAVAHFITEETADKNLRAEGIVGSVMVGSTLVESADYVLNGLPQWLPSTDKYAVVTLHRPESVDDPVELARRLATLLEIDNVIKVKMICHPRTKEKMGDRVDAFDWQGPLCYKEMLELMLGAAVVITDSGGLQEETTILGIPCITWRDNTERPMTISQGTNMLTTGDVVSDLNGVLQNPPSGVRLPCWDGHASERVVQALKDIVI